MAAYDESFNFALAVSLVLSGLHQLVHNLTLWIVFSSDIVACQDKRGQSLSVSCHLSISVAITFQRKPQQLLKLSFPLFFQARNWPVGIIGEH